MIIFIQQGVCFAFIEFEDSTSAQSAIEVTHNHKYENHATHICAGICESNIHSNLHKLQASPIIIGGRQIYVEERKFTPTGSTGGLDGVLFFGYN